MKPYIHTALLILMSGFGFSAVSQDKASIIKQIRKEYHRINSVSSFHIVKLDTEDFTEETLDGGAELTAYYIKDSLLKITEWVGLSYGNRSREYYFKNKQLFFVFESFDSFVETKDGLDHSKTKNSFQGRYYFSNTKLIHKIISGKKPLDDEPLTQLQIDAKNIIKLFDSKKK